MIHRMAFRFEAEPQASKHSSPLTSQDGGIETSSPPLYSALQRVEYPSPCSWCWRCLNARSVHDKCHHLQVRLLGSQGQRRDTVWIWLVLVRSVLKEQTHHFYVPEV